MRSRSEEPFVENKVGRAGGRVQVGIVVEVVVERLDVEVVVVERLVVEIGGEVGEVLQLQGWRARWMVGENGGKPVGEWWGVKLVWKRQGV